MSTRVFPWDDGEDSFTNTVSLISRHSSGDSLKAEVHEAKCTDTCLRRYRNFVCETVDKRRAICKQVPDKHVVVDFVLTQTGYLFTSHSDSTTRLWRWLGPPSTQQEERLYDHQRPQTVTCVTASSDGLISACSEAGIVAVRSVKTGADLSTKLCVVELPLFRCCRVIQHGRTGVVIGLHSDGDVVVFWDEDDSGLGGDRVVRSTTRPVGGRSRDGERLTKDAATSLRPQRMATKCCFVRVDAHGVGEAGSTHLLVGTGCGVCLLLCLDTKAITMAFAQSALTEDEKFVDMMEKDALLDDQQVGDMLDTPVLLDMTPVTNLPNIVVFADRSGTVTAVDLSVGAPLKNATRQLSAHDASEYHMFVCASSRGILTGCGSHVFVWTWDGCAAEDGFPEGELPMPEEHIHPVHGLDITPCGSHAVAALATGACCVWCCPPDVLACAENWQLVKQINGSFGMQINAVCFEAVDPEWAASGSGPHWIYVAQVAHEVSDYVRILPVTDDVCWKEAKLSLPRKSVSFCFLNGGRYAVLAQDRRPRVYSLRQLWAHNQEGQEPLEGTSVEALDLAVEREFVRHQQEHSDLDVNHIGSIAAFCTFEAHGEEQQLAAERLSMVFFTGSMDGSCRAWEFRPDRSVLACIRVMGTFGTAVTALCLDRTDGSLLFTGGYDGVIRVWQWATARCVQRLVRPDGTRLHEGPVLSLSMYKSSKLLAGSEDCSVSLWNGANGNFKLRNIVSEHGGNVNCVFVGFAGERGVTVSSDTCVLLWNLREFTSPQRCFVGHKRSVVGCAITKNGRDLVTADRTVVRVWDLYTGALKREELAISGGIVAMKLVYPQIALNHSMGCVDDRLSDNAQPVYIAVLTNIGLRIFPLTLPASKAGRGHLEPISNVAMAPDGSHAVTADFAGLVILWKVDDLGATKVRNFAGHTGPVFAVDMLCDRQEVNKGILVSAGADAKLMVWNFDGEKMAEFPHLHHDCIRAVHLASISFQRDEGSQGKIFVLSGSLDEGVRLMDVERGRKVAWVHAEAGVSAVVIGQEAPLAGTIAVGSITGLLEIRACTEDPLEADRPEGSIWDPAIFLRHHTEQISAVSFGETMGEHCLMAGSIDGIVSVWALDSGLQPHLLRELRHDGPAHSLAWVPGAQLLLIGSSDRVVMWDVVHSVIRKNLMCSSGATAVAASEDGSVMMSAGVDERALLWDLVWGTSDLELDRSAGGHGSGALCVVFSEDNSLVASGSKDDSIIVWDLAQGISMLTLQGHRGNVSCLAFSADADKLLSGSWDQSLALWDLSDGQGIVEKRFIGHKSAVLACAMSEDRKTVFSCARAGLVKVWDASEDFPTELYCLKADEECTCICLPRPLPSDAENPWIVVSSGADIIVWSYKSQRESQVAALRTKECRGFQLSVDVGESDSSDECSAFDPRCPLKSLRGRRSAPPKPSSQLGDYSDLHLRNEHRGVVSGMALIQCNGVLVSGDRAGCVLQWDTSTWTVTRRWSHVMWTGSGVDNLDVVEDGTFMALSSGGVVTCFVLSDLTEHAEPTAVWRAPQRFPCVRISPTCDFLASACLDGVVRVHRISEGAAVNSCLNYNWASLLYAAEKKPALFGAMLRANPDVITDVVPLEIRGVRANWGLIHYFAVQGDAASLKALVEAADRPIGFVPDGFGMSPLDLAALGEHREALEFLLQHGTTWPPEVCEFCVGSLRRLIPMNLLTMPSFLDAQIAAPRSLRIVDVIDGSPPEIAPPSWAMLHGGVLNSQVAQCRHLGKECIIGTLSSRYADAAREHYADSGVAPLPRAALSAMRGGHKRSHWWGCCPQRCCPQRCCGRCKHRNFTMSMSTVTDVVRMNAVEARQLAIFTGQRALRVHPVSVRCIFLSNLLDPRNEFLSSICQSTDPGLFKSTTVQVVLRHMWHYNGVKRHVADMCVFLGMILSFTVFTIETRSSVNLHQRNVASNPELSTVELEMKGVMYVSAALTMLCAFWFLNGELRLFFRFRSGYFTSLWNVLDAAGLLFVLGTVFSAMHNAAKGTFPSRVKVMSVIASFLLWGGIFFYLRGFQVFGSLVRMVVEIARDMLSFLTMMGIALMSFTVSLYLEGEVNEDGETEASLMEPVAELADIMLHLFQLTIFGNYQLTDQIWTSGLGKFVFLVMVLFLVVLMLNLLIALMGDTFARVKATELVAFLRERADLMYAMDMESAHRFSHCDGYIIFSSPRGS